MLGNFILFQAIADQNLFQVRFLIDVIGIDFEKENFINLNYHLRLFDIAVKIKASPLECAAAFENSNIFDYIESQVKNKYFPTSWWGRLSSYVFSININDYRKNFHQEGFSLLHAAVYKGDVRLAQKIITEYQIDPNKVYFKVLIDDINRKEKYYLCVTPLVFAFIKNIPNKKEMAKFLIQNGAKHCVEFSDGSESFPLRALSPLSYAIIQNDIDLAQFVIEELKAPLDEKDHLNRTPLMQTVISDTPQIPQLLIQKGALLNTMGGERYAKMNGSEQWTHLNRCPTALHVATLLGNVALVKILVNAKCDLNLLDKYGYTALGHAIEGGHKEITELLIQKRANPYLGATVKKEDEYYGRSAVEVAAFLKDLNLITLFYSGEYDHIKETETLLFDKETLEDENSEIMEIKQFFHRHTDKLRLCRACRIGDMKELEVLLDTTNRDLEVDLFTKDEKGNAALHIACIYHQPEVVRFLLEKGSNIDELNRASHTPLIALLKSNNPCEETLRVLLENWPDLERRDSSNMTALMHAKKNKNKRLFEYIWRDVAKQTDFTSMDSSLFLLAVKANDFSIVKEGIEEADIYAVDEKGRDALIMAAPHLDCKIAKLLLSKGIHAEWGSEENYTAFHYALKSKNIPLCIMLIAARLLFLIANNQLESKGNALHFLLKQVDYINPHDRHGRTLLEVAIENEHFELVGELSRWINTGIDEKFMTDQKNRKKYRYNFEDILSRIDKLMQWSGCKQKMIIEKLMKIYKGDLTSKCTMSEKSSKTMTYLYASSNACSSSRKKSLANENSSALSRKKKKKSSLK